MDEAEYAKATALAALLAVKGLTLTLLDAGVIKRHRLMEHLDSCTLELEQQAGQGPYAKNLALTAKAILVTFAKNV